jgi:hypothetical protein
VQALAHLGAAVVDEDRAVREDEDSAPAWLKTVLLNEMPNLTGVIASPRFTCSFVALNAATPRCASRTRSCPSSCDQIAGIRSASFTVWP